jgi:hypothetical protein
MLNLKLSKKIATLFSGLLIATCVQSASYGNANTFTGMVWNFSSSSSGLSGCSRLQLDATADFVNGTGLNMSGFLNCSGGAYGVFGSAFLNTGNTLSMTVNVGVNRMLTCQFSPTLSSSCTIYNSAATVMGTAFISLL